MPQNPLAALDRAHEPAPGTVAAAAEQALSFPSTLIAGPANKSGKGVGHAKAPTAPVAPESQRRRSGAQGGLPARPPLPHPNRLPVDAIGAEGSGDRSVDTRTQAAGGRAGRPGREAIGGRSDLEAPIG